LVIKESFGTRTKTNIAGVYLGSAVRACRPCPRLDIPVAVVINTTIHDETQSRDFALRVRLVVMLPLDCFGLQTGLTKDAQQ